MPFQMQWVPAPADPKLPVLKKLPKGAQSGWGGAYLIKKEGKKDESVQHWHECPFCKGWIPGEAFESEENTLGPLSGRSGTATYCRRCGREIGFSGVMS